MSIDFIIQLKIQQYISQHNQKKAVSLKSRNYVAFDKRNYKEDHKFKDGDHVTISTYKKCFAKVYVPSWSEEGFLIKKVKNFHFCGHMLSVILTVK